MGNSRIERWEFFIWEGIGADTFLKRLLRLCLMPIVPIALIIALCFLVILYIIMVISWPFVYLFTGENILED